MGLGYIPEPVSRPQSRGLPPAQCDGCGARSWLLSRAGDVYPFRCAYCGNQGGAPLRPRRVDITTYGDAVPQYIELDDA